MNRRDFARLLAIGGAAPFVTPDVAWATAAAAAKLPPTPASPDEKFWMAVRDQFVMPKDLTMLNAANLCPSSGPVLETSCTRRPATWIRIRRCDNRVKLGDGRENTRKALAEFLRVTPEEIVITRNTSESNNLVSTGIDLKAGDEVLLDGGQPSEQPHGLAGEGEAIRLHGDRSCRRRTRTRDPSTTSTRSRRRSRRGRR